MVIDNFCLSNAAKEGIDRAKNYASNFVNKKNVFNKKYTTGKGSGIILTNNETKDMKVIKSLENRRILLKGTTRKITSQEGGFLSFLRPLITAGLSLTKNVLTPFSKSVFIQLELTGAASAADAPIEKKIYGSGTTALIISNEKIEDITKIVKSLEESRLLIKGISETIKNETKKQKRSTKEQKTLLGTLAATILGNALTGRGVIRVGEGVIKAGQKF